MDVDKTTKPPAAGVQLDPSPARENQAATPLLFQGWEPRLCLQTPARSPTGAMFLRQPQPITRVQLKVFSESAHL